METKIEDIIGVEKIQQITETRIEYNIGVEI